MLNQAIEQLSETFRVVERRAKPRIMEPFPVTVHGMDASGESFEVASVLDNLSASGLYLRLEQRIEPGTTLFIISLLTTAALITDAAPRLALHGVVLRSELRPGGFCGVAVALSNHKFL